MNQAATHAPRTDAAQAPRNGIYIYPGSFDPITFGHFDIISRASCMCGHLIIAVGQNREKKTMFTVGERIEMIQEVIATCPPNGGAGLANTEVVSFDGLLADYAKERGANVIVKGLRAMSDFEYEFQMALLNKYLDERLETVFLMTNVQYTYINSGAVKEIALNGGCLDGLVPACVIGWLRRKTQK